MYKKWKEKLSMAMKSGSKKFKYDANDSLSQYEDGLISHFELVWQIDIAIRREHGITGCNS